MYRREDTIKVKVGNIFIGNSNEVVIQSMTTTKTSNINETIEQIKQLEKIGCQLVRIAILDEQDALSIPDIKKSIDVPLVADIHFSYKLAIMCIENGIDKIRINPGNIKKKEEIEQIVKLCKEKQIPIRIGVNSGSLPSDLNATPENMIEACNRQLNILKEYNFENIVLSFKSSDIDLCYKTYKLASTIYKYPLHVGITEAGTEFSGIIKSSIGISRILELGIGNTIRVSLTSDPSIEIKACKEILRNLHLLDNVPELVSCPTCGRCQYDMMPIAHEIEKYLEEKRKKIKVAVMGCAVNGPGEAMDADIGIAGGKNEALLFKKGRIIRKISQKDITEVLKKEIDDF